MNSPREHLDDQLADFVLGRLDADRTAHWRDHLRTCEDCAGLVRTAQRIREEADRVVAHLLPERIVTLADGADHATSSEARHLETCAACAEELALLRSIEAPAELRATGPRVAPRPTPRPHARSTAWTRRVVPLGLVALAASLLLFLLPRDEAVVWSTLSQVEPLPVRVTRSGAEAGSADEARLGGLEAYREGDWATAAALLDSALARGADDEVRLYRASALLLLDRDADAIVALEPVLDPARSSASLLDEARWLRLQIALRADDAPRARALAREVAEGSSRHATAALALLGRLEP